MFSGERAEDVSYAAVAVSIPPDNSRQIGTVSWPASLPGDPHRDFVTVSASYLDKQQLSAAVSAAAKPDRELVQEGVEIFDLTKLKGGAHNKAFEDITTVMTMIKDRGVE